MRTAVNINESLSKVKKYIETGDIQAADDLATRVLNKKKDNLEAVFLKGCIEYKKTNYKNSISLFEKVIKKDPTHTSARMNLGVALNEENRLEDAVSHLLRVVKEQPNNFIAYYNLGNSYRKLNKLENAKKAYLEAIRINPNYGNVYTNLGVVCKGLEQEDEAREYYEKGVELTGDPTAYSNLIALCAKNDHEEAYKYAVNVTELHNPGNALLSAFPVLVDGCGWGVVRRILKPMLQIATSQEAHIGILQDLLLSTNTRPDITPQESYALHHNWGQMVIKECSQFNNHKSAHYKNKKLRIGYLSGDFRLHSVGFFIQTVLYSHDTDCFDIFCYSRSEEEDQVTKQIKKTVTKYRDVSKQSHGELAKTIYEDGIHILIDLSGHTTNTAVGALAYKPAPVQMTYLGYANTTGLDTVDFRITDRYAESDEGNIYSEALIYMPESFLCFGTFADRPIEHGIPAENNGYITFASFNNVRKITEHVVRVWSEILNRVPNSRLIIKSGKAQFNHVSGNIHSEFEKYGIHRNRVDLRGHIGSRHSHLDFYNQVDIALDTFPYNGTTTTCEALWMGVPVITLAGKVHAQRVSYSILKNTGIDETIAWSEEQYIDIAAELAKDLDRLKDLHANIPTAVRDSILCDPETFTRQIENLYISAWNQKGYKLPEAIHENDVTATPVGESIKSETELNEIKNLIETGNYGAAKDKAKLLLLSSPDDINAQFLLGTIEYKNKNYNKSIELLSHVVDVSPASDNARLNLGAALNETGSKQEAAFHYKKILDMDPDNLLAMNNLGKIYHEQKDYDKALQLFRRVIEIDPDFSLAYFNMGGIFASLGNYSEAVIYYEKARSLNDDPNIHACLVSALKLSNQHAEAYEEAKSYVDSGKGGEALLSISTVFDEACDWEYSESVRSKVIDIAQLRNTSPRFLQNILLGINAWHNIDRNTILDLHRKWGKRVSEYCMQKQYGKERFDINRNVRIGYVSPDFCGHSVGMFFKNIATHHNKDKFDVYCYSDAKTYDQTTLAIKEAVTEFSDITKLSDQELANKIINDSIDILVDLAGHTSFSRLKIFAEAPAPVQITYLGYPNTTGLDAMDYRITDQYAEHEGGNIYTEKLLYLPGSFLCFGEFEDISRIGVTPAIKNGHITFGSFNNLRKLTPESFASWCKILIEVPESRLVIKAERAEMPHIQENILKTTDTFGIDRKRIDLRGFTDSKTSHLEMYNDIDIALDTFPYNGTTTTCEALWMGVPVVTLVGNMHAQRVSYSILKNININETIAYAHDEYENIAISLANDVKRLGDLRAKIPSAIRGSILCNPQNFVQQLEDTYLQAWHDKAIKLDGGDPDTNRLIDSNNSNETGHIMEESAQVYQQNPGHPDAGKWTEIIDKFPYAKKLSPLWLQFLEKNQAESPWKLHQMAMDLYISACKRDQSEEQRHERLMNAYQILYELVKTHGNISNLQTFIRIAVEINEHENVSHAIKYVKSLLSGSSQVSLSEPFIAISKQSEQTDPGKNIGKWLISSIDDLNILFDKPGGNGPVSQSPDNFSVASSSVVSETTTNTSTSGIRRLHIGGKEAHPDWEIINAIPGPNVDHVGNAVDLSRFSDNTFDEIYGSHVLEHFDYAKELIPVLKEWRRVLKPGGKLHISVPDLDILAELLLQKDKLNIEQRYHVMRMIFGGQIDEYDYHKVGLNEEFLKAFLNEAGFTNIVKVETLGKFDDTSNYKPYDVAISLNMIAEKKDEERKGDRRIFTANINIDVYDDDIFLVSYPRSGNTWLRFLLAYLVKGADKVDFKNIERYAPDIYRNHNNELLEFPRPRILKSHEAYQSDYKKVIYLYRDVRDVIVSGYFYTMKQSGNMTFPFNDYLLKFLNGKTNTGINTGDWGRHVQGWLSDNKEIMAVKYESMLADPFNALCMMLENLNIKPDENTIRESIKKCDFSEMQRQEKQETDVSYLSKNRDISFIRQGRAGGWKELFTKEHKNLIKKKYGELLIELGYEDNMNW